MLPAWLPWVATARSSRPQGRVEFPYRGVPTATRKTPHQPPSSWGCLRIVSSVGLTQGTKIERAAGTSTFPFEETALTAESHVWVCSLYPAPASGLSPFLFSTVLNHQEHFHSKRKKEIKSPLGLSRNFDHSSSCTYKEGQ